MRWIERRIYKRIKLHVSMKESITYILAGIALIEFVIIILLIKNMGDSINIKRQVQRNRRSSNNKQEYNSEINTKKREGIFKRLKNRKNGKN